jgi:hypothetical protein
LAPKKAKKKEKAKDQRSGKKAPLLLGSLVGPAVTIYRNSKIGNRRVLFLDGKTRKPEKRKTKTPVEKRLKVEKRKRSTLDHPWEVSPGAFYFI